MELMIYVIKQGKVRGYDTYDAAVVIAESKEEARRMHPSGDNDQWRTEIWRRSWVTDPEDVEVERIGVAVIGSRKGVVVSNYKGG